LYKQLLPFQERFCSLEFVHWRERWKNKFMT